MITQVLPFFGFASLQYCFENFMLRETEPGSDCNNKFPSTEVTYPLVNLRNPRQKYSFHTVKHAIPRPCLAERTIWAIKYKNPQILLLIFMKISVTLNYIHTFLEYLFFQTLCICLYELKPNTNLISSRESRMSTCIFKGLVWLGAWKLVAWIYI